MIFVSININYSINQNFCYILIIPGFGIVSHVISTFSGKPIFGQTILMNGPCINIFSRCFYIATYYMQEGGVIFFSTKGIRIFFLLSLFALVITYLILSNPQITNAQLILNNCNFTIINDSSMLVGTSETVRMFSNCSCSKLKHDIGNDDTDLKVRQWIAGVIDGDGNFHISKKGYVELSVVMETRDIACLYKLKQRYGGSVKATSHAKAIRFRLHHSLAAAGYACTRRSKRGAGIQQVISDVNGLIQNPVRLAQLTKVCNIYKIDINSTVKLNYNSAYLSGLIDSDGSVYYNKQSMPVFNTVRSFAGTQKGRELLDILVPVYGGASLAPGRGALYGLQTKKVVLLNEQFLKKVKFLA